MILSPKIPIGRWKLSFTMLSLYTFETDTGLQLAADQADIRGLRSILRAMLIPNHPGITHRQAGGAFTCNELPRVFGEISALIAACLPEPTAQANVAADKRLDWHQVWAIGRFDLRLSEIEFWKLTPLMWDMLVKRVNASTGNAEASLTMEEHSARLLDKVVSMNTAMGGVDLRQEGLHSGHRRHITQNRR